MRVMLVRLESGIEQHGIFRVQLVLYENEAA